jgi:hypothetical protein
MHEETPASGKITGRPNTRKTLAKRILGSARATESFAAGAQSRKYFRAHRQRVTRTWVTHRALTAIWNFPPLPFSNLALSASPDHPHTKRQKQNTQLWHPDAATCPKSSTRKPSSNRIRSHVRIEVRGDLISL